MKFIDALNLPKTGDKSWTVLQPLFICVDDYSEMQGKPHFSIMVKGAKAMKLADEALSKILNPHASDATVKAVAKLKKEIARIQNLANKERQMNMRVEYSSQLKKLNAELVVLETPKMIPIFNQEEAMTADTVSKLARKAGWRDFGDHFQKGISRKTATILKANFGGVPNLIDFADTDYGLIVRVWYSRYKPIGMAWGDIEDIDALIKDKPPVPVFSQEENSTIDIKTKNMSRLNRVFGQVGSDPTDGFVEGAVDEQWLDPEDDLNLVQIEEEVCEPLPESLRKELLRSVQCDSTKVAMKTPHALITEGFVSVETSGITDITVREAISELGSPDFVFLKEGVYTEVLMVTPLLPMAESVASEKSRDWRQVSIEDVPHLYLKF